MFAKSTQIGLVSLFAVLATALGGCAESVGNERASGPVSALSYVSTPTVADPRPMAKIDPPAAAPDARLAAAAPAASTSHRRDDCGR